MAYEIVPYAPEFDPQIAQLQTHLWSSDPARNAAYLRWKYADNPYLNEPPIQLALCDGRVVAMRAMFGSMWEVADTATRHLLPHADDFVVEPPHRNRGLASQIMKASLADASRRGFPFAVALSVSPVTFISSLAAGWRLAGSYQSVWRHTAVSSHLVRLRNRLARQPWSGRLLPWFVRVNALLPGTLFNSLDRAAGHLPKGVSLSCTPRPEEMAQLVACLPWDGRIRHVRDADYFRWRFRNPLNEYRFLFTDEGGLRGYMVMQRYLSDRFDKGCVNIADWEASDDGVRRSLLEAALQWGRFGRTHVWTTSVGEPVRTLLRDRGFQPTEPDGVRSQSKGLLVRRLGDARANEPWTLGGRDPANIANWDLRMLFSMAA